MPRKTQSVPKLKIPNSDQSSPRISMISPRLRERSRSRSSSRKEKANKELISLCSRLALESSMNSSSFRVVNLIPDVESGRVSHNDVLASASGANRIDIVDYILSKEPTNLLEALYISEIKGHRDIVELMLTEISVQSPNVAMDIEFKGREKALGKLIHTFEDHLLK